MPRVEPEEGALDLSQLTTDEWMVYLFDHPVVRGAYWSNDIDPDVDFFEYGEPEKALAAIEGLFRRFREVGDRFSLGQINQGVWGLWGPDLGFHQLFWRPAIPWHRREPAIRAMFFPYRDFVAGHPAENMENCFYMWWDLIKEPRFEANRDEIDRIRVRQAHFETLKEILQLPDDRCQSAALHGLGHLDHPDRPKTVQTYRDRRKSRGITPDERKRLEECRDGTAM